MKTQEHTAGPWKAERRIEFHDDSRLDRIYYSVELDTANQSGGKHAAYIARVDGMRGERMEANARLIAAAPQLLEALRELTELVTDLQDGKIWSRNNVEVHEGLAKAEKAIRSAKGETL